VVIQGHPVQSDQLTTQDHQLQLQQMALKNFEILEKVVLPGQPTAQLPEEMEPVHQPEKPQPSQLPQNQHLPLSRQQLDFVFAGDVKGIDADMEEVVIVLQKSKTGAAGVAEDPNPPLCLEVSQE
jgi:hypothetical protein